MLEHDGMIHTVTGEIRPEEAELTLMHQHLLHAHSSTFCLSEDRDKAGLWPESVPGLLPRVPPTTTVARITQELQEFYRKGGRTLVELSSVGIRLLHMEQLCQLSRDSNVKIVAPAGYYKWQWATNQGDAESLGRIDKTWLKIDIGWDADEIARQMLHELTQGIDGIEGNPKAGIIGELGISPSAGRTQLHHFEENNLRGAARAHRKTGAPINIHINDHPPQGRVMRVLEVLAEEGADLRQVVVSHRTADNSACLVDQDCEIAETGASVEYDLFAYEPQPLDLERVTRHLNQVIADGERLDRVLITADIIDAEHYADHGYGYGYTIDICERMISNHGFRQDWYDHIMIKNPARILAWH